MSRPTIRIIGLSEVPEVKPGDDIASLIVSATRKLGVNIEDGDVLVVTSKIMSKAENRLVKLEGVIPSSFARRAAKNLQKDPRLVDIILGETKRIVKMVKGLIISETRHGLVCANAGVDQSNVKEGYALLLPVNPDRSARKIAWAIKKMLGIEVGVIVSDSFGRPWREGQVDVAIGVAGFEPLLDYRGKKDAYGYELKATVMAVADELASAAELVMGKLSGIPVVLIKGYSFVRGEGSVRQLIRKPTRDLFR